MLPTELPSARRIRRLRLAAPLALLAAVFAATPARAVPLAPGSAVATPGTTSAARPVLAGTVLQDVVQTFTITDPNGRKIKGTIQDRVVRETSTGTLDFYYRIMNDSSSRGPIVIVSKSSFAPPSLTTDVDWRIDGLGDVGPTQAKRSGDGSRIDFNHASTASIHPGKQSRFVFVKTDATEYREGGQTEIGGDLGITAAGLYTVSVKTFEPVAPRVSGKYFIYQLQRPAFGAAQVLRLADKLGVVCYNAGALLDLPADNSILAFGSPNDPDKTPSMVYQGLRGSLEWFPDLSAKFGPAPEKQVAERAASRFLQDTLAQVGLIALLDQLRSGPILTTAREAALSVPAAQPNARRAAQPRSAQPGGTTGSGGDDVIRTVPFVRTLDGLMEEGPLSRLSVDIAVLGDGSVRPIGLFDTLRPILKTQMPVVLRSQDQVQQDFQREFSVLIALLRKQNPNYEVTVDRPHLVYYEQGKAYVQPAYRFDVHLGNPLGGSVALAYYIAASQRTPEPILNEAARSLTPKDLLPPDNAGATPGLSTRARGLPGLGGGPVAAPLIAPLIAAPGGDPLGYGMYVVRKDHPCWVSDAWGFHLNLDFGNFVRRFWDASTPTTQLDQYFYDYPWMWENDPTDSVPDDSRFFVGTNSFDLIEGHGAPWEITTLSNYGDIIDLNGIAGYGGYNGLDGQTAYVAWHSCFVIPAPGDSHFGAYSPGASPFDVWFTIFQGMRGTYGSHTSMFICDGVGPAYGFSAGMGVPNLTAWFHAEANSVVGHGANDEDYAGAVVISGHEGDRIYDTSPLPPPGSLTIWWQHP